MHRLLAIVAAILMVGVFGCSQTSLADFTLGAETYPDYPDCKQAYFKGKPIPGIFLTRLIKADGDQLEGIACHSRNIVIDVKAGSWKEGNL